MIGELPRYLVPDYAPLEDLLSRFRYKPGWEFHVDKRMGSLRIRVESRDSDKPGETISVHFPTKIPPLLPGDQWSQWLRHQILQVEKHEMDEFFQVDGRKPFDPHE